MKTTTPSTSATSVANVTKSALTQPNKTCPKFNDDVFAGDRYKYALQIIESFPALIVFGIAASLFVILATCRKLNWTVNLLFIAATLRAVTGFLHVSYYVHPDPAPPLGTAFLIGNVLDLVAFVAASAYVYRRLAKFLSNLIPRRWRLAAHTGFVVLIAGTVTAAACNLFIGGTWAPEFGVNVWKNEKQSPALMQISVWTMNLQDAVAMLVILTGILVVQGEANTKDASSWTGGRIQLLRAGLQCLPHSSDFRIVVILGTGIISRIAITYLAKTANYGGFNYVPIITNYTDAFFSILFLIDASLMLLYTTREDKNMNAVNDSNGQAPSREIKPPTAAFLSNNNRSVSFAVDPSHYRQRDRRTGSVSSVSPMLPPVNDMVGGETATMWGINAHRETVYPEGTISGGGGYRSH